MPKTDPTLARMRAICLALPDTPSARPREMPAVALRGSATGFRAKVRRAHRSPVGSSSAGSPKRGNSAAVSRKNVIAAMRPRAGSSTPSAQG
jgi:hypothetical protein